VWNHQWNHGVLSAHDSESRPDVNLRDNAEGKKAHQQADPESRLMERLLVDTGATKLPACWTQTPEIWRPAEEVSKDQHMDGNHRWHV
jgi:hypothetical protein